MVSMRARTAAMRSATVDAGSKAGDDDGMDGSGTLSNEARILWDAARGLARKAASVSDVGLPPLLFFTDPARTPEPWRTAERLPAGAGVVYRHFGAANAETTARRLKAIAVERDLILLIGLDADLAQTVGADGVHLPERASGQATILRAQRPDWLLTGAAHSPEAPIAEALNAVVLSPIFLAGGGSAARPALGVEALKPVATRRPVYALGGINPGIVDRLAGSGACGIAGVDAIHQAFAA
jgi:thiamine-phosphate pyrophosphorylase